MKDNENHLHSTSDRPLRIGYMLRMYPRVTQTFVVNEILELERQGVNIQILSLRESTEDVRHESVTRVRGDVHNLPPKLDKPSDRRADKQDALIRDAFGSRADQAEAVLKETGADRSELIQAAYAVQWAKGRKIDHVHVHFGTSEATVALLAHRLGGLSYSLTLHAFDIFRDNVDKALLSKKINATGFTITVSEYNRRYLVETMPGVDPNKIRVNYNGIDLERFAANGHPRERLSIFAVGRLIEKKGFEYLIRAIARLRDEGLIATCRIAGDGREEMRLIKEIDRTGTGDLVELLGSVDQARVLELTQQAQCFVLPCVHAKDGNVDALPTVLLESLACGCPSVSTRISGVPEIIESEVSGLLVAPGDDEVLAQAMGRILRDEALAARLSTGGRQRAEARFDIRRNVATMHEWLRAIVTTAPVGQGEG